MLSNAVGGVCRYWEVDEIVSKGVQRTRYMLREEIMLQRQLITHKIKAWLCDMLLVEPNYI